MSETICLESDYSGPCRYSHSCPLSRQVLQHRWALRGVECWAFVQISEKTGAVVAPQGDAP